MNCNLSVSFPALQYRGNLSHSSEGINPSVLEYRDKSVMGECSSRCLSDLQVFNAINFLLQLQGSGSHQLAQLQALQPSACAAL